MTGPEHYAEAERLLALADCHTRPFTLMASRFTKRASGWPPGPDS
jgi:hypothetical protein